MKINKYLAAMASLVLACTAVSCSDKGDDPTSATKLYFFTDVTSISEDSEEVIPVTLAMSSTQTTDVSFNVVATGSGAEAVVLTDTPVTIPAGQTEGKFYVKSLNSSIITEAAEITFSINALNDKAFTIEQNATITILPEGSVVLTEEQKALIESYKAATGIDLTPWMGAVKCEVSIEFPGGGSREAFTEPKTINYSGKTLFNLSQESTQAQIVLDMVKNPLGLTNYLQESFLGLTVNDSEYFDNEDSTETTKLMELLGWNKSSAETFNVTLPGLWWDEDGNVNFIAEGEDLILDANGQPIYSEALESNMALDHTSWIPFKYSFTAWDRQLKLFGEGNPEIIELMDYDVTANPAKYLGITDVNEDGWEDETWIEPTGKVDWKAGTMTFQFPFDHADQSGYSKVTVKYSIK